MFDTFKHKCEFVCIYINEAHAVDEWPVRTDPKLCIKQHQTLHERCSMAKSLTNDYKFAMPVYVDTIENTFENTYAAWPLRAFIVEDCRLRFILQPKCPGFYDLKDLQLELIRRFN